jgi:glutaredoxin
MFAFYFYSNSEKCSDCIKAGNTLTKLREKYPELRVYSFDYLLDLSVIKTLISIFNIEDSLPAMVMGDKVIYGYKEFEELEKLLRDAYPREMKLIDDEKKAAEEAEKTEAEAEKKNILLELPEEQKQ